MTQSLYATPIDAVLDLLHDEFDMLGDLDGPQSWIRTPDGDRADAGCRLVINTRMYAINEDGDVAADVVKCLRHFASKLNLCADAIEEEAAKIPD